MNWIIEKDEIGLVWARCDNCGKVVPAEKASDTCPRCREAKDGGIMDDLISRKAAMSHPFANGQYDHENANKHFIMGFESYKEWLSDLPSAQPNSEKSDRFCKTCHYFDEFLGGVFFCRRVKESKRVQPNFWCKKWRDKHDKGADNGGHH